MKLKRSLIIGLIATGVFLAVLITVCLAWNYSLNKQLDQELESIKNKNEPVSYDALIPPLVPDEQNAYLVYKNALQSPGFSDLTNTYNERFNLLCDIIAGRKPESLENIREIDYLISVNSPLIDTFLKAGSMEKCRVDIDYSNIDASDMPTPFPLYLRKVRDAYRFLQGAILVKKLSNQQDDAIKIIDAEIKMLCLWEPPCLIKMLMEFGAYRDILSSVKRIIKSPSSNEAVLMKILQRMESFNPTERSHKDFLAYRITNVRCIENLTSGNFKEIESTVDVSWFDKMFYSSPLGRLFLKAEKLYYLKTMRQLIEVYSQPPYQTKLLRERISRETEELPFYLPVARMFLSGLDDCVAGQFYLDAEINLTKTAVLLNLYKLRKGTYPDGLNDLPDDLKEKLSKDPFSGVNFIYRNKNDGFILYSIGPNYKDDDGINNLSDNKDDISW